MTTENRQPDPTIAPGEPRGTRTDERAQGDTERAAPAAPFDPNATIKHLTHKPGVYRMLDAAGEVIYVGKARDLRKRVDELFPGRARAGREDHRDGAHDRGHRGHGHAYRDRSADARVQPDQAASAALQRRAARRQELSVHSADRESCVPAAHVLPRPTHEQGPAVRPVSERGRGPRDAESATEAVPAPELRGQLLREPKPAVPPVPDPALHRAVRRADLAGGLRARPRARGAVPARPQRRRDRAARRANGAGGGEARVRARGAVPRSAREAQERAVAAAHGEHARRLRRGRPRRGPRHTVRRDHVLPRRALARQPQLLPEGREGRVGRGRDHPRVPAPVLRRPRGAEGNSREPRRARGGGARRAPDRAVGSQGRRSSRACAATARGSSRWR